MRMNRTNIYLLKTETEWLDKNKKNYRLSRSGIIRKLIDSEIERMNEELDSKNKSGV